MTKKEKILQDVWLKHEFKKGVKKYKLPTLHVRPYAKDLWEVLKTFHIKETVILKKKIYNFNFDLPKGFLYDACSVPRLFKAATNGANNPQKLPGGGGHDYGYRYNNENYPRKAWDKLFYKLLIKYGVSKIIAWKMYIGVRTGGFFVWKGHRKRQKKAGY